MEKTKLDTLENLLPLLHNHSNKFFYNDLIQNQKSKELDTAAMNNTIDNDDNSSGCENYQITVKIIVPVTLIMF